MQVKTKTLGENENAAGWANPLDRHRFHRNGQSAFRNRLGPNPKEATAENAKEKKNSTTDYTDLQGREKWINRQGRQGRQEEGI